MNHEETHYACEKRIEKEGGKATCCSCTSCDYCSSYSAEPDKSILEGLEDWQAKRKIVFLSVMSLAVAVVIGLILLVSEW